MRPVKSLQPLSETSLVRCCVFGRAFVARAGSPFERWGGEIEIKPISTDCLLQIAPAFLWHDPCGGGKAQISRFPLKFSFKKKNTEGKSLPPRARGEGTKNTSCGNVKKQKRGFGGTRKKQGEVRKRRKQPSGLCSRPRASSVLARERGKDKG